MEMHDQSRTVESRIYKHGGFIFLRISSVWFCLMPPDRGVNERRGRTGRAGHQRSDAA